MEKINRAQAFANQEKAASYMLAKKTLELNPHHPVIKELLTRVKAAAGGEVDEETKEIGSILYNIALLNSGFLIETPTDFTNPL
jgi:HSP90 family molecular chaperone